MKNLLLLSMAVAMSAATVPTSAQVVHEDIEFIPNGGSGFSDMFGRTVAIDNGIAVISAQNSDDNGLNSGSAYTFDATTGSQIAKLTALDASSNDIFGFAVAIENELVAVSAVGDDDNGNNSGSVYLFNATSGSQLLKLTPLDGGGGDSFGVSIAINNSIVAVGATGEDSFNQSNRGAVYLFNSTTGSQLAKLTASDFSKDDAFGHSVAMSDGVVAIGALADDDNGNRSGSAYLFDVDPASATFGTQIAKLTPSDGAVFDGFGSSIGIENGIVAIGAPDDDDHWQDSGSVYLFDADPSSLTFGDELNKLTAGNVATGDEKWFGYSINIDRGVVAIGQYSPGSQGSVYLFSIATGEHLARLQSSLGGPDQFGKNGSIDNGIVIAGDNSANSSHGVAYGFDVACLLNIPRPTLLSSYATPDLAREVVVNGTTAYIADGGSGLQVLDVSDLESPALIGSYDSPGFSQGVSVVDSTAYIADGVGGGLLILDVSDPTSPVFLSSYNTLGNSVDLTVVDDHVYVADSGGGLLIFDVSEPSAPILLGSFAVPDAANRVEVIGSVAYLAAGTTGIYVLDVSDPTNPFALAEYDTPGYATGIVALDSIGYVSDFASGLLLLDLSDPLNPAEISNFPTVGAGAIKIEGTTAYVADSGAGLKIIDVSDPASPILLASYDTPNSALDVFADGAVAFIADNNAGLQIISLSDCGTECQADLNGDDSLDFFDVSAFLVAFSSLDPIADFTGDGSFDFFDVSAFLTAFSAGCP